MPRASRMVKKHAVLPESKSMCKRNIGIAQELERSCRLLEKKPVGNRLNNSRLRTVALDRVKSETTCAIEVSPSEGNEVRREGQQEVTVPDSTVEAGEHFPVDPVEGSMAPIMAPILGNMTNG
jgi:hypothetical protein